ncbi:hypothetical protein D3C87_607590 [compost metagenome]
MFIIAHEIGHHLSNHFNSSDPVSFYNSELQADKFASSVLYRMGATLTETLRPLQIGFLTATDFHQTHPDAKVRMESIREAWTGTMKQLDYSFAVPPPPEDDEEEKDNRINFNENDFYLEGEPIGLSAKSKEPIKLTDEFEGIITRLRFSDTTRASYTNLRIISEIQVLVTKTFYSGDGEAVSFDIPQK